MDGDRLLRGIGFEAHSFHLNPEKKPLVKMTDLNPIVKRLRDRGWKAKVSAKVKGKTGVDHKFALIVWRSGSDPSTTKPDAVADLIISSSKMVDEGPVLALFAKSWDVGATVSFLVAVPRMNKRAKKLAESYKMRIGEASSPGEARGVLRGLVESVLRESTEESLMRRRRFDRFLRELGEMAQ